MEIRQGRVYPLSLDIKAEYDRFLKYYYYGIGTDSRKEDETEFTFEKKELQIRLGRGFSPHLVVELHYVLRNVRYFNVKKQKPFTRELEDVGDRFSPYATLLIRYDTSDSQIHPRKGFRLIVQNDIASELFANRNARYHRFSLDFRKYFLLFGKRDVVGVRFLVQKASGSKIPLFELPVLGGGSEMNAMRGFKLNRFMDRGKFLCNLECRFPLWKKLGGNMFVDWGSVWPSWSEISLMHLRVDLGWGLRYYLHNFVVRFDMGFSDESIGIYFNFGHVF
ncbi:MAG: BamA/TamA family outer membrane protein [Candidatus Aminicenantales bacterium]